jgi:5-methyltetrahydrofolate corrinoid/iron sulfur protein methyltransferase
MKRPFIIIGENIHCTRIFKVGGANVKKLDSGAHVIAYNAGKEARQLPIPERFTKGADWEAAKVKHCAVAVWQGLYGKGADQAAGIHYLQTLAAKQEAAGARFLDINIDEFSTDGDEKLRAVKWVADVVQKGCKLPLSIDSSNPAILRAGLAACDRARGPAMVNSVSLERADAIAVAAEFKAAVVASAAGEKGLPSSLDERLANIGALLPKLQAAGIRPEATYVDPLVFPISTDSNNGKSFLETIRQVRARHGEAIHITGGFSNVSFGMPARKLINQVFTWLAVEAGADSGIVDPMQINGRVLDTLDANAETFRLAKALLTGEDEFGAEFIAAHREGKLGE